MAPSELVGRNDLNPADGSEGLKADPPQTLECPIVPNGSPFWRGDNVETGDRVIGRELKPIRILAERQGRALFEARTKRLSRQQPDRWDFIQIRAYDDIPDFLVVRRKDKFFSRLYELRLSVH